MTLAIHACLFGMMRCNQEGPPNTSSSAVMGRPFTSGRCSGSLRMEHINRYRGDDRQVYELRWPPYKTRLRELRGRTVIKIWTTGQCCWRIYSRFRFQGEDSQLVPYGAIGKYLPFQIYVMLIIFVNEMYCTSISYSVSVNTPTFTPKSARKARCS